MDQETSTELTRNLIEVYIFMYQNIINFEQSFYLPLVVHNIIDSRNVAEIEDQVSGKS